LNSNHFENIRFRSVGKNKNKEENEAKESVED
jgi:hypothetical protein